ncbi:hypothetical protein GCM10023183_02210 [Nibribacter koreensis]|uniref:DNA-directed RNA polymerase subunit omega n=1 Tax=Nibribacter koreensis TaxID=1084519 RepID=A0ABP8F639_9BACT
MIEVKDEAYKAVTHRFSLNLMGTRLRKLDRILALDEAREVRSKEISDEGTQKTGLSI